jgi:hypothetical protein
MPGNPRDIIVSAEQRFLVRIRVGVPPDGFGQCHAQMTDWLDENCESDGWAMSSSNVGKAQASQSSHHQPGANTRPPHCGQVAQVGSQPSAASIRGFVAPSAIGAVETSCF